MAKIVRCEDEHEARSLEYRLKRMSRSEKVALLGLDIGDTGVEDCDP